MISNKRFIIKILPFVLCVILCSCDKTVFQQKDIDKLDNDTTLILSKYKYQKSIWGLNIKITGQLKDTISYIITNKQKVEYKYLLIGQVDTTFHADWYCDTCLIKLENIQNPIYNLKINYDFLD